jgi:hypothetical protein
LLEAQVAQLAGALRTVAQSIPTPDATTEARLDLTVKLFDRLDARVSALERRP